MKWPIPQGILPFLLALCLQPCLSFAQPYQSDKFEELKQLRNQTEEAMAVGDPQGAALFAGKAALWTTLAAKQETDLPTKAALHALEALLRAQEQVYRAFALFQQSGEHIPVSTGICQTLSLAASHQHKAHTLLPADFPQAPPFFRLPAELEEWNELIGDLIHEWGC